MNFLIPAKKNSERVANKNMRLICGKPLIAWTFDAVLGLDPQKTPKETYVSSDDPDILRIASVYGFNILQRPESLAGKNTTMSAVLEYHKNDFFYQDDVCVLYPTSPLRKTSHIQSALELWRREGLPMRTLMSVTEVKYRPHSLMQIGKDYFLSCLLGDEGEKYYQSQNQPSQYRANGAIYIIPYQQIGKVNSQLFLSHQTIPFIMNEMDSLELDNESDIDLIEWQMSKAMQVAA